MEFHNVNASICKSLHNHIDELIHKICIDLGHEDQVPRLVDKYLSNNFIKLKPMKDPTRPKRALSAYMIFCNDVRTRIMDDNKGAQLGDISKLIAAEWQALSIECKEPFIVRAEEEREKYEEALLDWKVQN